MIKSRKAKIVAALLLTGLLYFFLSSLPSQRSQQQNDFDSWLSAQEILLSPLASQKSLEKLPTDQTLRFPVVSLLLSPSKTSYTVRPDTDGPFQVQKLLRLLQLMRESNIFSVGSAIGFGLSSEPQVLVRVQGTDKVFETSFTPTTVEGNLRPQLLLKLFTEYGANS